MKEFTRIPVKDPDTFLHYLLKKGVNLRVALVDWSRTQNRGLPGRQMFGLRDFRIHYIDFDHKQYGMVEFEPPGNGGGREAVVWVSDLFESAEEGNRIKAIIEQYPNPTEKLTRKDKADLLLLEAISHRETATTDSYRMAIRLSSFALTGNPKLGLAWNCQGAAFAGLGQNEKAINCYLSAIAVEPNLIRPWVNLGNRYKELNDMERSQYAYRIATRLVPPSRGDTEILNTAFVALATSVRRPPEFNHLITCRYDELFTLISKYSIKIGAREFKKKLIELVLKKSGRWQKAYEDWYASNVRESDKLMCLHDIALVLAGKGRYAEAVGCCDRLLRDHPDHPGALEIKILSLLRLDHPLKALTVCKQAARAGSNNPGILFTLALIEDGPGRRDRAVRAFRQFLDVELDQLTEQHTYADRRLQEYEYWYSAGHLPERTEAGQSRVKAEKSSPAHTSSSPRDVDNGLIKRRDAHLLALVDNHSPAKKKKKQPELAAGIKMARKGRWVEALKSFDRILSADPADTTALENKACCLTRLGRFDEAVALCNAVLKNDPHHPQILATRGESLIRRALLAGFCGRKLDSMKKEALECYEQSIGIDGRHPGNLYSKALAEDALGLKDKAFRSFCQFIAVRPKDDGEHVAYARRRLQELAVFGAKVN